MQKVILMVVFVFCLFFLFYMEALTKQKQPKMAYDRCLEYCIEQSIDTVVIVQKVSFVEKETGTQYVLDFGNGHKFYSPIKDGIIVPAFAGEGREVHFQMKFHPEKSGNTWIAKPQYSKISEVAESISGELNRLTETIFVN